MAGEDAKLDWSLDPVVKKDLESILNLGLAELPEEKIDKKRETAMTEMIQDREAKRALENYQRLKGAGDSKEAFEVLKKATSKLEKKYGAVEIEALIPI